MTKSNEEESLDDILEGSTKVSERSELAEVFDNFDDTRKSKDTGESNVDKNTQLSETELKCMCQMSALRTFGIVSSRIQLDNNIKILNMSKNGWNKEIKARVATAGRESSLMQRGGALGAISKLFTPREG